jgi:hypothetical protein
VHFSSIVAAIVGLYFPAVQFLQSPTVSDFMWMLYFPPLHFVHSGDRALELYFPLAQSVQELEAGSEYIPFPQSTHACEECYG